MTCLHWHKWVGCNFFPPAVGLADGSRFWSPNVSSGPPRARSPEPGFFRWWQWHWPVRGYKQYQGHNYSGHLDTFGLWESYGWDFAMVTYTIFWYLHESVRHPLLRGSVRVFPAVFKSKKWLKGILNWYVFFPALYSVLYSRCFF